MKGEQQGEILPKMKGLLADEARTNWTNYSLWRRRPVLPKDPRIALFIKFASN